MERREKRRGRKEEKREEETIETLDHYESREYYIVSLLFKSTTHMWYHS